MKTLPWIDIPPPILELSIEDEGILLYDVDSCFFVGCD